jgi:AraC family L-rhamnose operon transcriptional activator RhaR
MPENQLLHLEDVFHRYAQRCPVPALYSWQEEYASEHVHDFFELRICAEGALDVVTRNGRCQLTAGDAVLLRPGTPHVCGNARLHTGYIIGIPPDLLHQELAWTLHDPMLNRLLWSGPQQAGKNSVVIHLPPGDLQRVQESLKVLLHNSWLVSMATPEPALHSEQIGHLTLLLSRLSRALATAEAPGAGAGRVHPSLVAALRLLEKEPAHDWSLAELTGKLGLDRSYLIRLFRQTLGLPPIQYLFRSRLELAARLLTSGDTLAGEVAGKVGWLDQTLFCRHFRKRFGMSPLQYRKRFQSITRAARESPPPAATLAHPTSDANRCLRLEPAPLPQPPSSTTGKTPAKAKVRVSVSPGFQLVAMGRQQLMAGETWNAFPADCHGVIMADFGRLVPATGRPCEEKIRAWKVNFCRSTVPQAWRATQDSALRWIAWRGREANALVAAGLMDQVPAYLTPHAANRVMDAWHKLVHLLHRTDPAVAVERQAILLEMLSGLACPEDAPSHYAISG